MPYSDLNGCPCDFCTVYGPAKDGRERSLDEIKATPAYRAVFGAEESAMSERPDLPYVAKFVVREKREHTVNVEASPGKWGPARRITVIMAPVTPNTPTMSWSTEAKSDENARFWSATPSGAFEIAMTPEEAEGYAVGALFKIHFGPAADGDWTLSEEKVWPDSPAISFTLYPRGRSGKLEMQVQQPSTALSILLVIHKYAFEAFDAKIANPDAHAQAMRWAVALRTA